MCTWITTGFPRSSAAQVEREPQSHRRLDGQAAVLDVNPTDEPSLLPWPDAAAVFGLVGRVNTWVRPRSLTPESGTALRAGS